MNATPYRSSNAAEGEANMHKAALPVPPRDSRLARAGKAAGFTFSLFSEGV